MKMEKFAEAKASYEKCLQIEPGNTKALESIKELEEIKKKKKSSDDEQ